MTSVTDSVIFGNILSTPECAAIWSDKTRTKYYLDFEASLAKVQADLGIVSPIFTLQIQSLSHFRSPRKRRLLYAPTAAWSFMIGMS